MTKGIEHSNSLKYFKLIKLVNKRFDLKELRQELHVKVADLRSQIQLVSLDLIALDDELKTELEKQGFRDG